MRPSSRVAAARCGFGRYLGVAATGSAPPVREVVQSHPPKRVATEQGELVQGLTVRLQLRRAQAYGELDLGEDARFFPTDDALSRWREGAHEGQAAIVYE
mgnify:CR=1 FL=1